MIKYKPNAKLLSVGDGIKLSSFKSKPMEAARIKYLQQVDFTSETIEEVNLSTDLSNNQILLNAACDTASEFIEAMINNEKTNDD